MRAFAQRRAAVTRPMLDDSLAFLVSFGVLEEFKPGVYRILARYLSRAIKARDPESLLEVHQQEGERT